MTTVLPTEQEIDLGAVRASFVDLEPGNEWVVRFLVRKPFRSSDNQYTKQQIINALSRALKGFNWWDGFLAKHPDLLMHFPVPLTAAVRAEIYTGPPVEDWPLWGRDRAAILLELARITPIPR